jgi:signal transduction histidine kinase
MQRASEQTTMAVARGPLVAVGAGEVVENQNVLIVEDDAAVSEVVAALLTEAGYHPVPIADHALIAQTVERWRPRCVIIDGELLASGENRSWRDAAAIRRAHPTLPVVLFTGDSAVVAEARAGRSYRSRAARFAGIVSKPFEVDDLIATVKAAVQGSQEIDVLAVIVHELRQPLTVIQGRVQLALRQLPQAAEAGRAAMSDVLGQVGRMDDLIDQLLDQQRLTAKGFNLNVTLLDLVQVVAEAIARHEDGAATRISFEGPSGAVPVYADAGRLAQIMDNLLSNAFKYSPTSASIAVSLTTDGVTAEIRIADRGVGVPEEERALLFTPFYRTSNASGIRGTGLGLHISRRLAEHHGGRLWLDTSSSTGSTLALALPVARDDALTAQS